MEGAGEKLPDQWLLEKNEGRGNVGNRLSGTGLPRLCKDREGVLLRIPGVEQEGGKLAEV